ncbi:EamA family transporter [Aquihabitans daechungensis]|uniref:EamA family transporter n=1 Tax=Aquihabitans daechungensis TaxID=1052257 RepID=UPI003B9DCA07
MGRSYDISLDAKYLDIKMMTMKTTALRTVLAPVSWGTTYVTVTELLPAGRPLLVAAGRVAPAGLLLLAIGTLSARWRPHGAEWGRTALLALCNFGLFFPLLIGAVYRLPGGVAAAAGGVQPLLVTAFSWILVRRPPRRHEVATGVVAAVGVALVVVRPGAGLDPVGVLLALGANVSFATGVVLTKRFPARGSRIAATGWQLAMAGAVLLPLAVLLEGPPPQLTGANLGGFGYLGIVATGVAYLLWFDGIRKLPAAAPPLLGLAAPVTGAALGWLVLGQTLSGVQLLGFAVTLAAIGRGATLPEVERRVRSGPWPAPAASTRSARPTGGVAGSAMSPSTLTCR